MPSDLGLRDFSLFRLWLLGLIRLFKIGSFAHRRFPSIDREARGSYERRHEDTPRIHRKVCSKSIDEAKAARLIF